MPDLLRQIESAKQKLSAGQLEEALREYLAVLRLVTPDDAEIRAAMVLSGLSGGRSTSASVAADILDSRLRAEIVDVLRHLGRFSEAQDHAEIALFLDRFIGEPNNIAASLHDLGLIALARGQSDGAWRYFKESEAVDARLRADGPVGIAVSCRKLVRAEIAAEYGFVEEAVRTFEEILPRIERDLREPLKLVDAMNAAAQCLQNLGEHARAIEHLRRAIRLQEAESNDHPQFARLLGNLAIALHERGNFEEADAYRRRLRDFPPTVAERASGMSLDSLLDEDKHRQEVWIAEGRRDDEKPTRAHDIFISYNVQDEPAVLALHEELSRLGARTWIFKQLDDWRSLKAADQIVDLVSSEIEKSKLVVIVASGTSITSDYVYAEIDHALARNVPVVVWYPGGVRLVPTAAATRTDLSIERLQAVKRRLIGFGVASFYGYGLRERDPRVAAAAVLKVFSRLFPGSSLARRDPIRELVATALDGTRMLPVFVNSSGELLDPHRGSEFGPGRAFDRNEAIVPGTSSTRTQVTPESLSRPTSAGATPSRWLIGAAVAAAAAYLAIRSFGC